MPVGALIGAYQEDDSGGVRALLPLAGRTLVEYQVRCAAAAGAAPIVIIVERIPQALHEAFERLRFDGIGVFPVSDVADAVSRFEAGSAILLIGDGIAPPADVICALAQETEPSVLTVPDDDEHANYERIDAQSRWAGVALVDSRLLGSTAAMLGDWDIRSTLLRRAIQEGALRLPAAEGASEPLLVDSPSDLENFDRRLLVASRAAGTDWVSRYILPRFEEFATEKLSETAVRPIWLLWSALLLTLVAAFFFLKGWLGAGLVLLILSTPLDTLAARLANLRLRPLGGAVPSRRALWPVAGVALLCLGWWEARHGSGWGCFMSAVCAAAFAEAARIEKHGLPPGGDLWLFSRRSAIFAAIPFALIGSWPAYLVGLAIYAAISFFIIQNVAHSEPQLTGS